MSYIGLIAVATIYVMLAACGEKQRESSDCMDRAELSPISFGGTQNVEIEWEIEVSNCPRSTGGYDYVLVLEDENGDARKWPRGSGWGWQDSANPINTTDYLNVASDETLVDVEDYEITECICDL